MMFRPLGRREAKGLELYQEKHVHGISETIPDPTFGVYTWSPVGYPLVVEGIVFDVYCFLPITLK